MSQQERSAEIQGIRIRETRDRLDQWKSHIRFVKETTNSLIAAHLKPCQGNLPGPSENVSLREQNHPGELNQLCMTTIIALVIAHHRRVKLGVVSKQVELNGKVQSLQDQCLRLLSQRLRGPL